MKILHLQRTSAYDTNDLQQCLSTVKSNDALVLIDDGCYCLTHPLLKSIEAIEPTVFIYYIKKHADARAITLVNSTPKAIDMNMLIDLTFEYDSVITWQ